MQLLKSNEKHFKRDIIILICLGILGYIFDISTSKNLYQKCNNFLTQLYLLLHHILYIFSLFAFFSNNRYILILNIILITIMLIHWNTNNNVCEWTQQIKEICGIDSNLRSFIRILFPSFKDKNRRYQKIYLVFSVVISVIKLMNLVRN
jgi:hypothetical protein